MQTIAVNDAYTASPNLLFNTWFGWNQQDGGYIPGVPFSANALGSNIAPSPSPQLTILVNGYFDIIGPNVGAYNRGDQTLREVVTLIKGRHQLTFGGEMLRVVAPIANQYLEGGQFTFGGAFSGDNLADFMLGDVSTLHPGRRHLRQCHRLQPGRLHSRQLAGHPAPDAQRRPALAAFAALHR